MTNSFASSPNYMLTSESVTEGHPDKLCDRISDAVLDAILEQDPYARVACETAVTTGMVIVLGEITTGCYIEVPQVVREVIKDVGYTNPEYGFDHRSCGVVVSITEQSADIDRGVSASLETKEGSAADDLEKVGAGDQGMMVGFACNETPELMPLPISLAHGLCRRLAEVRKEGILPYLRPDGKSQVTVEYDKGTPKRVTSVVIAAQHDDDVGSAKMEQDIIEPNSMLMLPVVLSLAGRCPIPVSPGVNSWLIPTVASPGTAVALSLVRTRPRLTARRLIWRATSPRIWWLPVWRSDWRCRFPTLSV